MYKERKEERKTMENYSFTHTGENGVMTSLSFTVPESGGVHISSIHRMCYTFALALGYVEDSVEEYFGATSDESFSEFDNKAD